jgi:hypothetical protein
MTIPVSFRSPQSTPNHLPPGDIGRIRKVATHPRSAGDPPRHAAPAHTARRGSSLACCDPPLPPGRAHTRGPGPAQLPRRGGGGGAFRQLGNDNDVAWDGAATHPPRRPKKWDCGGCFTAWLGRDVAGLRRGWVRRGPGGRGVSWTSSCCARALKEATD